MSIKTVIAEDEPSSLERLKELLEAYPGLEIVGQAMDGLTAIELINANKPDVVLLDIRMPGANGLEVVERMEHTPAVIFVTAYDRYAIDAFDKNAVDYLLKPYSKERLHKAVRRAVEDQPAVNAQIISALKDALLPRNSLKRFAVKVNEEILLIPEEEVFCFNAEDKYVYLNTESKSYFYDATLKELETNLDPEIFIRIHKSTIVAIDKISKIKKWFRGEVVVQLGNSKKTNLRVSRSCYPNLKDKLNI